MNSNKTKEELLEEAAVLLKHLDYVKKYEKIVQLFPDKGPLRRELYKKHLDYFKAGAKYPIVVFQAANQIGKSTATLFETVCHLTGRYPPWWEGYRFNKPIKCWVVGYSSETVKKVLQAKLLGEIGDLGSGLIPRKDLELESLTDAKKANTPITNFRVKHKSGEYSSVEIKTYESGRKAFEGQAIDFIVLDEEPPIDVYAECTTRTITTGGQIRLSFTPLLGITKTITKLCKGGDWTPGEKSPDVWLTNCTWWDVPHLTKEAIERELRNTPEYLRDAKSKGIPQLNAGAVYPILEELVFIPPREIPKHWKRAFALDFGWTKPTAILWGAIDPDDGKVYFYSEHYFKEKEPMFHAQAIKQRNESAGFEIPGCCDPSGGGRSIADGKKAREIYDTSYKITMESADNSIAPGIMRVNDWFSNGKIRFFDTLVNLRAEFRLYRWNDKQQLVGEDHLMDCLKYFIATGVNIADNKGKTTADDWVAARNLAEFHESMVNNTEDGWMYR